MLAALITGFLLGFLGSVPVAGPIAVLVLERALAGHRDSAIGVAIGAAVAESLYAGAAFLGLGVLMANHPSAILVARLVAIVILLAIAVLLLRHDVGGEPSTTSQAPQPGAGGRVRGGLLGFGITALNPTLIATWSVVVASVLASGVVTLTRFTMFLFPLGVCLGIATWLIFFAHLVARGGMRLGRTGRERVRRGTAVLVALVAAWFTWQVVGELT